MTDLGVAIRVEGLGKQYRIQGTRAPYDTLRDAMTGAARAAVSRLAGRGRSASSEQFWALRDVTFDVQRGTALGVVGRNGAGKTTLLRILSRITAPSAGRAALSKSTSPLLSVGTGFHPELSGRDNVYLNGAVLGMSGRYIRSKFDEIVAFAEVERFIDTPIKFYSSGMQMRLGFAVAAFLEAEILLIDEVLAVGDAAFQKKCLAKIDDVAHQGRTVLFVSHHIGAVSQMCSRAIWLDRGQLRLAGDTAPVIEAYLADSAVGSGERTWVRDDGAPQPGTDRMRLRAVRVRNPAGQVSDTLDVSRPFTVEIEYDVWQRLPNAMIYFTLRTSDGIAVLTSVDAADGVVGEDGREPGVWVSRCTVMGDLLNQGTYFIDVTGVQPMVEYFFQEEAALVFSLEQTGGLYAGGLNEWPGVVSPRLPWAIERVDSLPGQIQAS